MVVLLFSPFIILPAVKSGLDVLLLAFLGAAAEQNDEAVSVLAEINAVAGPEIDAALEHPGTDALTFEKLPCVRRVNAVVTLAEACAPRRLNQAPEGLRPLRSLYSRTSIICYSNIYVTISKNTMTLH